jgi:putative ATPase
MKDLGFSDGYIYAHDTAEGIGEMSCLPDSLTGREFFQPGRKGFEAELAARMEQIRNWHLRRRSRPGTPPDPDPGENT